MNLQTAPHTPSGLATLCRLAECPADGEVCDMCAAFVVAPIDACRQLVGLIRRHRRGFSGGAEAWGQVKTFHSELLSHSRSTHA